MARFFLLALFLSGTLQAMEKFEGRWQGAGRYSKDGVDQERCPGLNLAVDFTPTHAYLDYKFSCKSFQFIDEVILKRNGDAFFQDNRKVGNVVDRKNGGSVFSLKGARFAYYQGQLQVTLELKPGDKGNAHYLDKFVHEDGTVDSFSAVMGINNR